MIEGYASAMSVPQGGSIGLHLSASTADVQVRINRYNIENGERPLVTVKARLQTKPNRAWEGYGWSETDKLSIASNVPQGLYELLDAKGTPITAFVVKAGANGRTSPILLHYPFLTEAAYSDVGGASLYTAGVTRVSLDRPHPVNSRVTTAPFLAWLNREGLYPDFCSGDDLENYDFLKQYDCLVLAYHDEYWTGAMRDSVERFIANGGNLVSLSGNTCMRQIRINCRMLELERYATNAEPDNTKVTINFPQPPLNRSQVGLLGVGFTWGAEFKPDKAQPNAYNIHFPDHWTVKGAAAKTAPFMFYETDAVDHVSEDGVPRVTGADGAPRTEVILASADLRDWKSPGWATMVYWRRNGEVFACGTTDWIGNVNDASIGTITKNVLGRLKSRNAPAWEDVGEANDVSGLAASGDRLFVNHRGQIHTRFTMCARMAWKRYQEWNSPGAGPLAASSNALYWCAGKKLYALRLDQPYPSPFEPMPLAPPFDVAAMAFWAGRIYVVDARGELRWTPSTLSGTAWRLNGTAQDFKAPNVRFVAMAAAEDILYAVADDGTLYRTNKDMIGESLSFAKIDRPKLANCKGLAAVGWTLFGAANDRLYAMDIAGLRFKPPSS